MFVLSWLHHRVLIREVMTMRTVIQSHFDQPNIQIDGHKYLFNRLRSVSHLFRRRPGLLRGRGSRVRLVGRLPVVIGLRGRYFGGAGVIELSL